MIQKGNAKEEIAAFVLYFVGWTLMEMTVCVREKYPNIPIVYSGGVMSCSILKKMLSGKDRYFAEPSFSSDNAAGIACLTRRAFLD